MTNARRPGCPLRALFIAALLASPSVWCSAALQGRPSPKARLFPPEASALKAAPLLEPAEPDDALHDSYIVSVKLHVEHDNHRMWVKSLGVREQWEEAGNSGDAEAFTSVNASIDWNGVPVNTIRHIYTKGFKGYAGRFDETVLKRIRESDEVDYVERDRKVYLTGHKPHQAPFSAELPDAGARNVATEPAFNVTGFTMQRDAPWGLARIAHRMIGFGSYEQYYHEQAGGEGVTVYVLDTGIKVDHLDFEGRARWGATIPLDDESRDLNGHGTHCAGVIAGSRYGVAKNANVVAVKVLRSNGSGVMSDVLKGIDFVTSEHHLASAIAKVRGEKFRGSVANLSLGGPPSRALDHAVNAAVAAGIHFAVAAGNDGGKACDNSPAAAELAVTVAASTIADERASFSNHGSCVDIIAPGKDIPSDWVGSHIATNTLSGTSMAGPHVAGAMAYMLSLYKTEDYIPNPADLKDILLRRATKGLVEGLPVGTPNRLLYIGPLEPLVYD